MGFDSRHRGAWAGWWDEAMRPDLVAVRWSPWKAKKNPRLSVSSHQVIYCVHGRNPAWNLQSSTANEEMSSLQDRWLSIFEQCWELGRGCGAGPLASPASLPILVYHVLCTARVDA